MISGGINLLPYSLGSVATYSCNTGSVLVGQTTRVCEDTNGGTVTTGTWSGSVPTCEDMTNYNSLEHVLGMTNRTWLS